MIIEKADQILCYVLYMKCSMFVRIGARHMNFEVKGAFLASGLSRLES